MTSKKIFINYALRKEIMAALGCTYPTVRSALNYKSDSELSVKIRKLAIEKGAVEMVNR